MVKIKQKHKPHPNPSFDACLAAVLEYHDTMERLAKDLADFELKLPDRISDGMAHHGQVTALLKTAKRLLNQCRTNPREAYVPHCLAAVDYFIEQSDAIPDFRNYDGFEDDQEVFESVIEKFRLPKG